MTSLKPSPHFKPAPATVGSAPISTTYHTAPTVKHTQGHVRDSVDGSGGNRCRKGVKKNDVEGIVRVVGDELSHVAAEEVGVIDVAEHQRDHDHREREVVRKERRRKVDLVKPPAQPSVRARGRRRSGGGGKG